MGSDADAGPFARRTVLWVGAGLAAAGLVVGVVLAVRRPAPDPAPSPALPAAVEASRLVDGWAAGAPMAPDDLRAVARAASASTSREAGAALCERAAAVVETRLPGADAAEWGDAVRSLYSTWRTLLPGDPFPALDPSSPRIQERYLALRARLRATEGAAAVEARALAEGYRDLGDDWWRRRNGPAALLAYEEAARRLAPIPDLDRDGLLLLASAQSGRGVVLLNLFRWSDAEAALRAAVAAREAASPEGERAHDLAVDRARWGWALLYAGRTEPAVAQLERALADLGDRADAVESREPGPSSLRARLRIARAVADGEPPGSPADRLEVGRVLLARRDGAAALPHFEAALAEPRLRADVREAPLYDAACAAAIAAETAPRAERAGLVTKAFAWLAEDLSIRRRSLADLEASGAPEDDVAAARARLETHLAWARGDDDLAFLRGTPEFEALFGR